MKFNSFKICYTFNNARVVFTYPALEMSDFDAWELASVHSGIPVCQENLPPDIIRLDTSISKGNVTNVLWHRSFKNSSRI